MFWLLFAVCCLLFVVNRVINVSVNHSLLLVVFCLLPAPVICCLLSVVCCSFITSFSIVKSRILLSTQRKQDEKCFG